MTGPHVVVMALGLITEGPGALFLRDGGGPRALALMAGALRTEELAAMLAGLGTGPLVAAEPTLARLDLARVDELRRAVAPPPISAPRPSGREGGSAPESPGATR